MRNKEAYNWTQIYEECPEFILNHWDVIFGVVALLGTVLSFAIGMKYKKLLKESVFLTCLVLYEFFICFVFIWLYTFRNVAVYLKNDMLAQISDSFQIKCIKNLYDIWVYFALLFISIEQFLWTCTPRTRSCWKIFTARKYKIVLNVPFAVYSFIAAAILNWNLILLAEVPFCYNLLTPFAIEEP